MNNHIKALINEAQIQFEPPNIGFIFHNKLPKSGSSTMNQILTVLSEWNNFKHVKINGNLIRKEGFPLNGFYDEGSFHFPRGRIALKSKVFLSAREQFKN